MNIEVLLFAGVREAASSDRVAVELPTGATYAELLATLAEKIPSASAAIASSRMAADGEFVTVKEHVSEHAELALIPPVSGG